MSAVGIKIEVRFLDAKNRWYVCPLDAEGNQIDFELHDCGFTECPYSHHKRDAIEDAKRMAEDLGAVIYIYTQSGRLRHVNHGWSK